MRTLRTFGLTLLAALSTSLAFAQTPAEVVPEAHAVVERFATVTKLTENLSKTNSRRERGSVKFGGIEGKIDSWSAKPDRQKVTLDLGGLGKMVSGCDGEAAWISGDLTGSRLLSGMDSYSARLESAYASALKSGEVYESMKNLGRETFEGKECWKLEFVAKVAEGLDPLKTLKARTSQEFYEISSGLLIGSNATMDGEMGSGPLSTVYSDYKDFGGVLLAATKTSSAQGVKMVYVTDAVEFDTAKPEDLAPPLEIQKMLEAAAAKKTE
ncbi:MAG: hypothetical protein EXS08_14185 [Planctomycetes bacterium]|nr:hypothetical protein [Planctomycetota bacterium]